MPGQPAHGQQPDHHPQQERPPTEAEAARLAAVRRYNILDTPPDGAFDRVAAMAARLFDVPVATVTIVDEDRIWFKATCGLDGITQIGRDPGLCASAILRDDTTIIPDTLRDPVACANPLVTGPLGVRFYAAAPITTADGHKLGTINVIDTRPRTITGPQTATLADLAAIVMDELELRLSALHTLRIEQQRRHAEHQRAETEHVTRQQAERDRAAIASFASTLQRTLLPPALPAVPGLEVASYYHAASPHQVGGDFYDLFPLSPGRWAFFLGDVCGKGAEAAALTSLTRYTLRAAAQINPDPITVLTGLNTALLNDPQVDGRFCTAIFGLLTPGHDGGFTVILATGGHPPAYHLHHSAAGPRAEQITLPGGMFIGAVRDARFTATTLRLVPGGALLLYTDGLTEARTPDGLFGPEGLTAFLASQPSPITATSLIDHTTALIGSLRRGIRDDIALLALSIPSPSTRAGQHSEAERQPEQHTQRSKAKAP